jgi:hypothetical protein
MSAVVAGKGQGAARVWQLMQRMRREMVGQSAAWASMVPEIDTLILIDRHVDMVTPLLTQLTLALADPCVPLRARVQG